MGIKAVEEERLRLLELWLYAVVAGLHPLRP